MGHNEFFLLVVVGLPFSFISLIVYIVVDNMLKRKTINFVIFTLLYLLLLPLGQLIFHYKFKHFFYKNKPEMELIALNLLSNKWTLTEAKNYEKKIALPLEVEAKFEEDSTVLFCMNSFWQSSEGIAYSKTGRKTLKNNYSKITHWKKTETNWYKWTIN